jgi:hypothetical protein
VEEVCDNKILGLGEVSGGGEKWASGGMIFRWRGVSSAKRGWWFVVGYVNEVEHKGIGSCKDM